MSLEELLKDYADREQINDSLYANWYIIAVRFPYDQDASDQNLTFHLIV